MAIICMACYDTVENGRTKYTSATLSSLLKTVNFERHNLVIIDNGSAADTLSLLDRYETDFPYPERLTVVYNGKNLGTAKAINRGIRLRKPGQHVVKMDNDVVIANPGWVDEMEECIRRQPKIGLVGLKRMDLQESPDHKDSYYRSQLIMLPHERGERWIVAEQINHMMGTCQMLSSNLLDKIGGFEQPHLYGYDDTIVSYKSTLLNFINIYLPHIIIDHIDTGGTPEHAWKIQQARFYEKDLQQLLKEFRKGKKPIYYDIYA